MATTESPLLDYRLSQIEEQLEGLKTDMQDMNSKTNQLVEALIGNQLTHSKGLVAEFKEVKKKVYEHEETLKRFKWFWLGVVSFGTILAVIIEFLLKYAFK